MNKDLNDYLAKFNTSEILLPNDYQILLNFITNESKYKAI